MDIAPIWKRILGGLIDFIVLVVLSVVFAVFFGQTSGSSFSVEGWPALGLFAVGFMYFVASEATIGKTLGKFFTGTRVVDGYGEKIGWGRSFARNFLRLVDMLPLFYIVGLITMFVSKDRQRVGDLAAKTFVING